MIEVPRSKLWQVFSELCSSTSEAQHCFAVGCVIAAVASLIFEFFPISRSPSCRFCSYERQANPHPQVEKHFQKANTIVTRQAR